MIFATVGSMLPFDRFAQAIDEWAARQRATPDVLLQIGSGSYTPRAVRWARVLSPTDFNDAVRACEIVVAHLGMGSVITAMQAQKPIILFPRRLALGEHNSDHQAHATEWLRDRPGLWIADGAAELEQLLDRYLAGELTGQVDPIGAHASDELIQHVQDFIFGADSR